MSNDRFENSVRFPSNFSHDAYYADLLLLISISKALFAGSGTIKTAAMQDMN